MELREFLTHFDNVKQSGKNQYTARCPVHGDSHNSLSIGYNSEKSHILVYCHAGCEVEEVLKNLGLEISDLYADNSNGKQILHQETYIYKDENSNVVYYKTRIDYGHKDKSFFFEQPNGNKTLQGAHRVPYNLPNVLNFPAIYFVEGEKCADILIKNGLAATTLDTGANSVWQDYYDDYFKDKEVIIIPDNDEAGLKYVKKILNNLSNAKVMILPNLKEKEDVYDWIKSGHSVSEFESLPLLSKSEFLIKYFSDVQKSTRKDNYGKETEAEVIIRLVKQNEAFLFHDTENNLYAAVNLNNHREIRSLESKDFSVWLSGLYYKEKDKPAKKESISQAISVLSAEAMYDCDEAIPLSNRVAKSDNAFWYSLSNSKWQAVKITADGWKIENNPPILFRQYRHQMPQVVPKNNGEIHKIFNYLNIKKYHTLFLCWLVSCFVPDIPHAMPIFYGEKGAAKSTTCTLLKKLIDPSALETLTIQKNARSMAVNLQQHWFLPFDNVSKISEETSDTLCRAITGGGIQQRKLFSDADDYIFTFKKCIAINGINNVVERPDLLDRAILIELSRISEDKRKELSEIQKEFSNDLPYILGGILDILSRAIQIHPEVKLDKLPRMADFACWGYAIGEALGNLGQVFLDEYQENYDAQNTEIINNNIVATLTVTFMENKNSWTGRISDLLNEFIAFAPSLGISTKEAGFPKQPNVLSRRLNELQSNLEKVNIKFKIDPKSDGSHIIITNKNISPLPPYRIPISEKLKTHNDDSVKMLADYDDDDDSVEF